MERARRTAMLVCVTCLALVSSGRTQVAFKTLDAGAAEIVKQLIEGAPVKGDLAKMRVGVGDFVDEQKAREPFVGLSESLTGALASTKAFGEIIERSRLAALIKQQGLAKSPVVDVTTSSKLGKVRAPQLLVVGTYSVSQAGNEIRVRARLVAVETAVLASSASVSFMTPNAAPVPALLKEEPATPPTTQDDGGKATSPTVPAAVTEPPGKGKGKSQPPSEPKPDDGKKTEVRKTPRVVAFVVAFVALIVLIVIVRRQRHCPNCRAKLVKGDQFCQQCGQKVS